MNFAEKLMQARKRGGLSQEQLADRLGVTRQSVSKWESGQAMPELSKLVALSELFAVSVDYLIKDALTQSAARQSAPESAELSQTLHELKHYMRGYQYTSKTRVFGIPLVCVRLSRRFGRDGVAKGIIAIGNVAIGVVGLGACSVGLVSFGACSAGLLALGALSAGVVSMGAVAVGVLSLGALSVGVYAVGAAAIGGQVAVGAAAIGKVAVGIDASGAQTLLLEDGITRDMIRQFLQVNTPNVWKPVRALLQFFATSL